MKQEISSEQFEIYLKQNNVHKLAKFFNRLEYAQQLIAGKPYLQAVRAFSNQSLGEGRHDSFEGTVTRPIGFSHRYAMYCLTAIQSNSFSDFLDSQDGKRMACEFAGSKEGCAVVINNPHAFLTRFHAAEASGTASALVAYDGELFSFQDVYQDLWETLFHKGKQYSYQHEFRIVTGHRCEMETRPLEIDGATVDTFVGYKPYTSLSLGDLSDIAEIVPLH